MDQDLQTTLKERFSQLPPEIKKALTTLPLTQIIEDISQKNSLHIDQSSVLYNETVLVLLGAAPIKDFQGTLEKEIGLSPSVSASIVQAINDQVFLSIREALQDIQEENIDSQPAQQPPNPLAPNSDQVSKDFISAKLTSPVNIATKGTKSYPSDPYREPIN